MKFRDAIWMTLLIIPAMLGSVINTHAGDKKKKYNTENECRAAWGWQTTETTKQVVKTESKTTAGTCADGSCSVSSTSSSAGSCSSGSCSQSSSRGLFRRSR